MSRIRCDVQMTLQCLIAAVEKEREAVVRFFLDRLQRTIDNGAGSGGEGERATQNEEEESGDDEEEEVFRAKLWALELACERGNARIVDDIIASGGIHLGFALGNGNGDDNDNDDDDDDDGADTGDDNQHKADQGGGGDAAATTAAAEEEEDHGGKVIAEEEDEEEEAGAPPPTMAPSSGGRERVATADKLQSLDLDAFLNTIHGPKQ